MAKTNTGKKRPDWVIEKINETRKSTWENLTYEERMVRLEPWIKAGQEASRKIVKDTKIERYVEAQLIATEIEYQKQFRIGIYSCDFYIPSQNKIIEVNGCFYHQCPECGFANRRTEEIRAKDARKVAYLESKGFIVEVIWEHSIDPSELKKFS
jgi:G:T-mismatch repair DNA endonuclease (very short patch repair protein)